MANVVEIIVRATNLTGGVFKAVGAEATTTAGTLQKLGGIAAIAGAAIAVAAVKAASDFQASTTRIVASAGEDVKNLELIRQGMLDMAGQVGYSADELAKGMYHIESAGFHAKDGLMVLKAAAQAAKAENADLADVGTAVSTVLLDYHLKASQAADVSSQMVAAVSHANTTFELFSRSLANVLPLASKLGISFADVAGAEATMTAHGMTAQRATMNLANAMRSLAKPNAAMEKEFKLFGLTTKSVQESLGTRGLTGTMQWLSQVAQTGSGKVGQTYVQALGKLMGTAPGLQAALLVTGKNAEYANNAIKDISKSTADGNGNVRGFAEVQKTFAFNLSAAKDAVHSLMIELGNKLLPVLTTALGWVSTHTGTIKVFAGVLAAVLLPLIVIWAAGMAVVAAETIAASLPIIAIIAVLGLLAYAVKWAWDHWKGFRDVVQSLIDAVMPALKIALDNVKAALENAQKSGVDWELVLKALAVVGALLVGVIVAGIVGALVILSGILRLVSMLIEPIKNGFIQMGSDVLFVIKMMLIALKNVVAALGAMPGPLGAPFRAMASALDTAINKVQSLRDDLNSLKSKAVTVTVTAVGNGVNLIQRSNSQVVTYQSGGRSVSAFAHGGIIGAQEGGPRSNWTMVGEHGRELVRLPFGSRAYSNPDTERMMNSGDGGSSGNNTTTIRFIGDSEMSRMLIELIRRAVRTSGSHNVQILFGGAL